MGDIRTTKFSLRARHRSSDLKPCLFGHSPEGRRGASRLAGQVLGWSPGGPS